MPTKTEKSKSAVRSNIIRAQHIKPSNLPEAENSVIVYKMVVVVNGTQKEVPCTKQVFRQIQRENLPLQVRKHFSLELNAEGLVHRITSTDKPSTMPVFNRVPADEDISEGEALVISMDDDSGELSVAKSSSAIPQGEVAAILEALSQLNPSAIDPGQELEGHKVSEVRRLEGRTLLHIQ